MNCQGCLERKLYCHQTCDDYIQFKTEREEYNKKKNDYLNLNKWTDSKINRGNNLLKGVY